MNSVRRANPRDAAALAVLAERTFRETFAHQNSLEDMDLHCRSHFGREIQAAEIRDPSRVTMVCEGEKGLIGFGQLRWSVPPACVVAQKPAEIQRLYVDALFHGRGIARALMDAMIDDAAKAGADVAWLGVWERNPRAIAFYAKCGFEAVGEHVFVLGGDPQRDLVLVRRLARAEAGG